MNFNAIIEKQLQVFPTRLKPFIHPSTQISGMERTWRYFAFAYERGFEVLAEECCRSYPNQSYLVVPLMQLARHSMELALKSALNECNEVYGAGLATDKHGLVALYDRLDGFLISYSMIQKADPWADSTRKVLVHFDKVDSTGMVFRYPTDLTGVPFDAFEIDIEELIIAHQNVMLLADATVSMLNEGA
ncbi:hypothetical protein [Rhizobium brockwellii]|uniref:hypothetical protein n=1 Tax=Rhizobium brockwellii TaxID=3019932 RepID=UPI00293DD0F6|nr:hypothetical protein [Rhizobium brockwellii]MDV4159223.1 hypothetical protein [Rhizobium brockwellii]